MSKLGFVYFLIVNKSTRIFRFQISYCGPIRPFEHDVIRQFRCGLTYIQLLVNFASSANKMDGMKLLHRRENVMSCYDATSTQNSIIKSVTNRNEKSGIRNSSVGWRVVPQGSNPTTGKYQKKKHHQNASSGRGDFTDHIPVKCQDMSWLSSTSDSPVFLFLYFGNGGRVLWIGNVAFECGACVNIEMLLPPKVLGISDEVAQQF